MADLKQPTLREAAGDKAKPSSALERHGDLLLGLFLILATLAVYQPVWHAGFIWDDDLYVTNNPLLIAPDGLWRIWFSLDSPSQYFPLTYTTFRFEHALWGFDSAGYHWVNILLHAANALLIWRLLKRLAAPGAWLAAAIFALHPVNVEAVAWITELKSILSLFFILLALLAWVEFLEGRSRRSWLSYALALVFYALALFGKTTACTLPAALLLIAWLKAKPINGTRLAQVVPFLALGIGMGLVTMWWERFHQHTQGKLFALGLPDRILIASHAVWFYLGKLIWPVKLTFSYPKWNLHPANPLAYGWLVAGIGLCAMICYVRRFTGRSVEVAALFFVVTLSPLLGFIMLYTFLYSYVADHYQYVACIGPIALAAAGITVVFKSRPGFIKSVICGALLLTLGGLTWRQCRMYRDAETLWETTIGRNPASWMAYNNLGDILFKRGELNGAIVDYQKSLKLYPDNDAAQLNLGCALFQKGQLKEGMLHLQRALEISTNNADGYYDLGKAYFQEGLWDKAISHFQSALEINPDYPNAENYLGNALSQKGDVDGAIAHYQRTLEIDPDNIEAQNNLAWILATSARVSLRDGNRAVELAERVNQLTSDSNPTVLMTLAAAYAEVGRFTEAVQTAQSALELAQMQSNTGLANLIQSQMKFYGQNRPFHSQ